MSVNSLIDLTVQQLKRAVAIREKIEGLEKEFNALLGATAPVASPGSRGRKRVMSQEARARIAASQRARWAKKKSPASVSPAKAAKRKISAAGRARIAAAARQRWARFRAAKAKA